MGLSVSRIFCWKSRVELKRQPSPVGLIVTHIFCWTPRVHEIDAFSPKGAT
jgi:hypothetical protein